MSCQAGAGLEPGPSALKASALPIELTWQTREHLIECILLPETCSIDDPITFNNSKTMLNV